MLATVKSQNQAATALKCNGVFQKYIYDAAVCINSSHMSCTWVSVEPVSFNNMKEMSEVNFHLTVFIITIMVSYIFTQYHSLSFMFWFFFLLLSHLCMVFCCCCYNFCIGVISLWGFPPSQWASKKTTLTLTHTLTNTNTSC